MKIDTVFKKQHIQDIDVLVPAYQEDKDILKSFAEGQDLQVRISGKGKDRSYDQLKLYRRLCKIVADNTEDINWNTADKVHVQCKVKLGFFEGYTYVESAKDGGKYFIPIFKSLAYNRSKHKEATEYISKAIDIMADFLGITTDELLENVKLG